ncbi:hypothetical protein KGR20_21895 [Cytobacillus oceanisediminis]|uniref:hypothetical protein n=1 Tax=Bacillaceae TaxID=186817 RepID=UPI001CCD9EB8|nr:hypothetical protein [Cytobacillus oceanisediminis]MBZ9536816.1 hypothetical protein [Cytobacillus oceanisediminis]
MSEDRSLWVTKEQLDTPLCDIFPGTKTNGTARIYVRSCEAILGLPPKKLEKMSYEYMNRYIDLLASRMENL